MTARKTAESPALATYAAKPLTPVIQDYVAWLKAETGYDVDPQSVALASALRSRFQKSEANQRSIAQRAADAQAKKEARVARAKERQAKREEREARILAQAEAILAAKKEKAA